MSEQNNIDISTQLEPRGDLDRLMVKALGVGALGAVAIGLGFFSVGAAEFYRAYLVGWVFCVGIAGGLLAIGMLNHVSGGQWGAVMRRVFEASGRTMPFLFLMGAPLFWGLETIYPWAKEGVAEHDPLIAHKVAYLNVEGFGIRAVVYFAVWSLLAYGLSALSKKHDSTGSELYREKMKHLSAAGLVLYVLLGTFAAVDWLMSLDPHWFSSLYGVAFVEGHVLSAFCFSVVALVFLKDREPFKGLVKTKLFHDYGKLMLAFIAVWGYFAVSQFLIIWSGNLPEEITWYLARTEHGWEQISRLLVLGQFVLPFIFLLSADLKKKPRLLMLVALWILAMRWFDLYWQVAPSMEHHAMVHGGEIGHLGWLDLAAPFGFVGIWLALLIWQFKNRPPVPFRDPTLQEILNHG